MQVTPSDCSMEKRVIGRKLRSLPTRVISVPCNVVIKGSRRGAAMERASMALTECGMATRGADVDRCPGAKLLADGGICYADGNMMPKRAKFADERHASMRARVGLFALAFLAFVAIALVFSGAMRGQAPTASASAPN